MKMAIVYSSVTGNTEELAELLRSRFTSIASDIFYCRVNDFQMEEISRLDGLIIGTYTWGDGEIPIEMLPLVQELSRTKRRQLVTGIFGTGDSFYPKYCGAVDNISTILNQTTNLADTLKIELSPQMEDLAFCDKFVERILRTMSIMVS